LFREQVSLGDDDRVQSAILKLLDDRLDRIEQLTVTWFGGEPLVGQKPLFRLSQGFIDRCERAHVSYDASIITNGYLLTEETCRRLRDARVSSAQVTIDGPPEIHDRMRPLANGAGTFRRIIDNLHHAIDYLSIRLRINIDSGNRHETEGFRGKLSVYVGHIVGAGEKKSPPSASYKSPCLTNRAFAEAEAEFERMLDEYGFGSPGLPRPTGAPCTAVRKNELVVGSHGELYKCWENVGDPTEVIGHLTDVDDPSTRLNKWLSFDPFANQECASCIALPVCMGGCAHHAMDRINYENRCGTFRHSHKEQVLQFVAAVERGEGPVRWAVRNGPEQVPPPY
jgi:uncharacterized protein